MKGIGGNDRNRGSIAEKGVSRVVCIGSTILYSSTRPWIGTLEGIEIVRSVVVPGTLVNIEYQQQYGTAITVETTQPSIPDMDVQPLHKSQLHLVARSFLPPRNGAPARLAIHPKRPQAQRRNDHHQAPSLAQLARLTPPE